MASPTNGKKFCTAAENRDVIQPLRPSHSIAMTPQLVYDVNDAHDITALSRSLRNE
jgi:hypothetical protein